MTPRHSPSPWCAEPCGADLQADEVLELSSAERGLKSRMLECFRTQVQMLSQFCRDGERFRESPQYDFSVAPHPGPLLYERWGWGISGSVWRAKASQAEAYVSRTEPHPGTEDFGNTTSPIAVSPPRTSSQEW